MENLRHRKGLVPSQSDTAELKLELTAPEQRCFPGREHPAQPRASSTARGVPPSVCTSVCVYVCMHVYTSTGADNAVGRSRDATQQPTTNTLGVMSQPPLWFRESGRDIEREAGEGGRPKTVREENDRGWGKMRKILNANSKQIIVNSYMTLCYWRTHYHRSIHLPSNLSQ